MEDIININPESDNNDVRAEVTEVIEPEQLSYLLTAEDLIAEDSVNCNNSEDAAFKKRATLSMRIREKKAGMTREELEQYYKRLNRRIFAGFAAAIIAMIGAFLAINKIYSLYPYAITMDDETICYVDDKDAAREVVTKLVNNDELEGADIKAIDADENFSINRADKINVDKVLSVDEAVECVRAIKEQNSSDEEPQGLTVVSTRVEEHTFTPDVEYVQDDSMFAGQQQILQENKDGKKKLLVTYTTVDGEITDADEELIEILDEGQQERIARGTLGLPDGADWKTYEGDPVFNDGADLVTTAMKYKGKVPYKLGGQDLNKGVSCLGLVKAIYAKYGIYLPMSHPGMKKAGIGVSYKNAQKGDIICYKSHVGIYVGDGKMIDATSSYGVSVRKVDTKKLVTVRRIPHN